MWLLVGVISPLIEKNKFYWKGFICDIIFGQRLFCTTNHVVQFRPYLLGVVLKGGNADIAFSVDQTSSFFDFENGTIKAPAIHGDGSTELKIKNAGGNTEVWIMRPKMGLHKNRNKKSRSKGLLWYNNFGSHLFSACFHLDLSKYETIYIGDIGCGSNLWHESDWSLNDKSKEAGQL